VDLDRLLADAEHRADLLFSMPVTTRANTSASRGVSMPTRRWTSAWRAAAARSRSSLVTAP